MRHTMGNHVMHHGSGVHGLGMPGLALDVSATVPGPAFAEVCVVVIVVDPVGEVEGVGLVVLCLLVAAMRHLVDHGARHDMAAVT